MLCLSRWLACILALAAAGAAGLGVWLIHAGANPPPGGGSLGHVGMIVAGLILCLASILCGGGGWLLWRRSRRCGPVA